MQIKPFNYNRFSARFVGFVAQILKVILQLDALLNESANSRVTQEGKAKLVIRKVNHFAPFYNNKEPVL